MFTDACAMRWILGSSEILLMTAPSELLSVRDLRVSFRMDNKQQFAAVKGVSFAVATIKTVRWLANLAGKA